MANNKKANNDAEEIPLKMRVTSEELRDLAELITAYGISTNQHPLKVAAMLQIFADEIRKEVLSDMQETTGIKDLRIGEMKYTKVANSREEMN